jgi:large subunit ribosomal protein L35
MPKQKTHKGLTKRLKITATGKIKRRRAGAGHLMSGKSAKQQRRVSGSTIMVGKWAKNAKLRMS